MLTSDNQSLLYDHLDSILTLRHTDIRVLEDWSMQRNEYTIISCQIDRGYEGVWLAISFPLDIKDADHYAILDNMIKLQTKSNNRTCLLVELPTEELELWVYKPDIERDRKRRTGTFSMKGKE